MIKVQGGTRSGAQPSLCLTCRLACVIRGDAESSEYIHCYQIQSRIGGRISSCSAYDDKTKPTLPDMYAQAWYLRTDPSKKVVGFCSPKEWRLKYGKEEGDNYPYE